MIKTTTIEQSQQLLDAGYLPDTADCFWLSHPDFRRTPGASDEPRIMNAPIALWQNFTDKKEDCIPAWSMSALWDLCEGSPLVFDANVLPSKYVMEIIIKHLIETSPYNLR